MNSKIKAFLLTKHNQKIWIIKSLISSKSEKLHNFSLLKSKSMFSQIKSSVFFIQLKLISCSLVNVIIPHKMIKWINAKEQNFAEQ